MFAFMEESGLKQRNGNNPKRGFCAQITRLSPAKVYFHISNLSHQGYSHTYEQYAFIINYIAPSDRIATGYFPYRKGIVVIRAPPTNKASF